LKILLGIQKDSSFYRAELDLSCMGFEPKYVQFYEPETSFNAFLKNPNFKKEDQNYLKNKLKIALKYQKVFFKALKYVLNKTKRPGFL